MWRYYELLTNASMSEVERMKGEAKPMQAKKDLAARIVRDFHSREAAAGAAEDWAKQFQKKEVPESTEEVPIALAEVGHVVDTDRGPHASIRADRLLVRCGLAASATDAARKIKQDSVKVGDQIQKQPYIRWPGPSPARFSLRVGKLVKIAIIRW